MDSPDKSIQKPMQLIANFIAFSPGHDKSITSISLNIKIGEEIECFT